MSDEQKKLDNPSAAEGQTPDTAAAPAKEGAASAEAKTPASDAAAKPAAPKAAPAAAGAGEAKPAVAAAKKPAVEEKPPEPGKIGNLLASNKLSSNPLGPDAQGIEMIEVAGENLLAVARFLRDNIDCHFDLLVSVSGVDRKDYRESVVHLYSTVHHHYLCIKTKADEQERVPSLMPVWEAADWHEREAYDLMGIIYEGHPDLRRILMPNDWLGHPLRKDYVENDPRLVWNQR